MQVKVDAKTLGKAVKTAQQRNSPRIDILDCVHIAAAGGGIVVTSTNIEITAHVRAACTVTEPGAVLIPAKTLTDICKAKGELTISALDEGKVAVGPVTLEAPPASNFPARREHGKTVGMIDAETLAQLAAFCLPHASKDMSRPILTGAYLELGGFAKLTTTDSYRMAHCERENPHGGDWAGIVPAAALAQAAKTLSGEVTVMSDDSHITLTDGVATFSARLPGGSYPDYRMPNTLAGENSEPHTEYSFSADEMLAAIQAVQPALAGRKNAPLRVLFGDTEAEIVAEADGLSATAKVATTRVGEPTDGPFGYNLLFLADCISSVGGGMARMRVTSPARPATVMNGSDESWTLIMPIRLA